MVHALLVGLIVFIGKSDYFIGTAMVGRPLVLGTLVGVFFGDIATGVMIGFQLELVFMGMYAIGASVPPDMVVGSVLGTAVALSSGQGIDAAITIAMPTAILSAFVVNLFYGVITPLFAKSADRYADEGNFKGIERVFLGTGFLFNLSFALVAFVAFYLGNDVITRVVESIPGWLSNGLTIAAGILPAVGFAQLITMISTKKTVVFILLGFLLTAYLNLTTIGVVSFSIVIIGVLLISGEFSQNNAQVDVGGDDNEF